MPNPETTLGGSRENFPETVWSTLLEAAGPSTPQRDAALNRLAALYWRPVYKFVRTAGGASIEDAKDLTQEFFSHLIEAEVLSKYDREKGRFRVFLKAVLRNFLSVDRRDAARLKRGGGRVILSLDVEGLETGAVLAERGRLTPEEAFDRQWAADVLAQALREMRRQFEAEGRAAYAQVYEAFHELGPTPPETPTYASVGRALGLTEQQTKDHLAAARARLEKVLRQVLSERVASPRELTEEINDLLYG